MRGCLFKIAISFSCGCDFRMKRIDRALGMRRFFRKTVSLHKWKAWCTHARIHFIKSRRRVLYVCAAARYHARLDDAAVLASIGIGGAIDQHR